MYLTETPVTETEIELQRKRKHTKLLLDSIFHYNELEVTEEIYLDFEEPYKLHSFEIIEDDEEAWNEDNLNSHSHCSSDDADFDSSYKRQAVERIGGIGTLIKKIITRKEIVLYKQYNINLEKFHLNVN